MDVVDGPRELAVAGVLDDGGVEDLGATRAPCRSIDETRSRTPGIGTSAALGVLVASKRFAIASALSDSPAEASSEDIRLELLVRTAQAQMYSSAIRAVTPLGHGDHANAAFELADDTGPLVRPERDRVGRDLRRRAPD